MCVITSDLFSFYPSDYKNVSTVACQKVEQYLIEFVITGLGDVGNGHVSSQISICQDVVDGFSRNCKSKKGIVECKIDQKSYLLMHLCSLWCCSELVNY